MPRSGPHATASCASCWSPTSRRRAAGCATPPRCAPSPPPGSPTPRASGLDEAREPLLDVRDALHLITGRATDRLALQEQDQVAAALGLLDADSLLRQVYEAARTLAYASDVTWREVGRVLRSRAGRGPGCADCWARGRTRRGAAAERTPLAEGVVEHDGEAVLARTARPDRDPVLPLRGRRGRRPGRPAARPCTRCRPAAPPSRAGRCRCPGPPRRARSSSPCSARAKRTVPVWEALEAEGLIARLLPDWERVRCRPQRNAVHRFTVDRHLVETAVRASALTRRVQRPDLLLVAALLHDIGKGWPGDHSVAGETIARDMAARIGFGRGGRRGPGHARAPPPAPRGDRDPARPGRPGDVRSVADVVGSAGTLELLHALTEADALATGPAAWSAWRGTLVADLVKRVAGVLAGEAVEEHTDPFVPTEEAERLAVEAWRTHGPVVALSAEAARALSPGRSR